MLTNLRNLKTNRKSIVMGITAFALVNLAQIPALAQSQPVPEGKTRRALEISIGGIGPAVDAKAFKAVLSVIGEAVAKGVVDTYITYGYGVEGGSSSCIQLSLFQTSNQLLQLKNELLKIKPDPKTTFYEVKVVAACRKGQDK